MKHDPVLNFIDGRYRQPENNQWIDNVDPARNQRIGTIANSDAADIDLACQAAERAFGSWSATPVEQRSRILNRVADLIDQHLDELVAMESVDGGKPVGRASAIEIPRSAANFRFFASAITQFSSELHESVGLDAINFTLRQPMGTVACISPWNLPLYLFTWKVAPALATGNCVVAKPSELTPQTAARLGAICNDAGLPPGVLNIIQGTGASAGQAILEHPSIKAVSFTGGSATGRHVASVVAPQLKKLSLELGGKNPNIVFDDCDFERCVNTSVMTSFANQGQICLCGSRLFVHRKIYDRFKEAFIQRTSQLKIGDPSHPDTQIGSLISEAHFKKVSQYLDLAKGGDGHANVLWGGSRAVVDGFENGFFIEPTIIEVDSNRCRLNQEEIFGPVVTLMPFEDESEAVNLANDVPYGLSATLWSQDVDRVIRVGKRLQSGVVWINTWLMRDLRTPFGGMKESGVGREGGLESLRFFTEPKNICLSFRDRDGRET